MRLYIFPAIAALVITSACTTTEEAPPSLKPENLIIKDLPPPPEAPLTQEQVDDDAKFLAYAMNNGYGGRKIVADGLKQALAQIALIKAPVSAASFKDDIDRALLKIPDNHLQASLNFARSAEREALEKHGRIGKNAIKDPGHIWEVSMRRGAGEDYLFIGITKFPPRLDPVWQGFIDDVKTHLNEARFIVLDLRGNGGGDDSKGIELALTLHGGDLRNPLSKQYISQTPETLVMWGNYFRLRKLRWQDNGKPIPEHVEQLIKEADDRLALALAGRLEPEAINEDTYEAKPFDKNKGYDKPIYILMDGECASSCESTIDAFEFHPHVKKLGENTGGFIHFGNTGFIVLPESKVEVQIPTHYNEYFDKRFIERIGIKPDRRVPAGTDALDYLLYKMRGAKPK